MALGLRRLVLGQTAGHAILWLWATLPSARVCGCLWECAGRGIPRGLLRGVPHLDCSSGARGLTVARTHTSWAVRHARVPPGGRVFISRRG